MELQLVHRKGAQHYVLDMLSRSFEVDELVEEVDKVDPWYKAKFEKVTEDPFKYKDWMINERLLYCFRKDRLLDPITD